jgi:hypothetical protein
LITKEISSGSVAALHYDRQVLLRGRKHERRTDTIFLKPIINLMNYKTEAFFTEDNPMHSLPIPHPGHILLIKLNGRFMSGMHRTSRFVHHAEILVAQ